MMPQKNEIKPFVDFYTKHDISPVSQDISDIKKHFERRNSLYRHLGLVPSLLKDKTVIEFGPGSGHNAVYTNNLKPSQYVLVDANPKGLNDTEELLSRYSHDNPNYEIVESLIEEYRGENLFDIVLCEGLISGQPNPCSFLQHVGRFVAPGGVLIITCEDSVSVLSDLLRHLAGSIIVDPESAIDRKVEILRPFFREHFETLQYMSRPLDDWILDWVIQPFKGRFMSIKEAINAVAPEFDVYGSSPHFFTDWRWYKEICGDKKYNEIAIDLYYKNVHNLMDYRYVFEPRTKEFNLKIIKLCDAVVDLAGCFFEFDRDIKYLFQINQKLIELSRVVRNYAHETSESITGFTFAVEKYLDSGQFPLHLKKFASFFGRGQQYLSFIREG